jgi:DNA-binding winged helix-turn-helix (wHTH) protein/WD40 repeat protein
LVGKGDKIVVGDFLILPTHNKIILDGQSFTLEPKIMDVLCYLIAHPNKVISKQEFLDALWPGQTLGQEVITRAIFELRKTFSDDAKQPKFISTIPRKGYCFIHKVDSNESLEVESSPKSSIPALSTLFAVAILSLCVLVYWVWPNSSQAVIDKPQLSLVSHSFDQANNPDVSPDGKNLIFVAEQGNEYLIVQTDIESQKQTIKARSPLKIVSPKWISDSEVVYGQCSAGMCQLLHFNFATQQGAELTYQTNLIIDIQVNLGNQQLLIANMKKGFRSFDILNLTTSSLLEMPDNLRASKPVWANSYRQVFFVSTTSNGNQTLNIFDIATLKQTQVIIDVDQVFALATMENDFVLMSSRKDGKSGIWQYSIGDKSLIKLIDGSPGEVVSELTYHEQTSLLIFKSLQRNIDIGAYGLDIDLASVNSDMIDMNAIYLNKRDQLVLISNRTGAYEIWGATQGEVEKLTDLKLNVIDRPIANKVQSQLAFTSTTRNMSQLRIFDLDTQSITFEYLFKKKIYLLGWSHDDEGLYYSSGIQGDYTIYYFSLAQQTIKALMVNAGVLLHENDQHHRYFINMATNHLMSQQTNGAITAQVQLPDNTSLTPHQAVIIDNTFYAIEQYRNVLDVVSVDLTNQQKQIAAELPRDVYVTQLAKHHQLFAIYDQIIEDKNQLFVAKFTDKIP